MEIFTAIIVAISSLLGVFLGVLLQFYFSRKKDYEANLLQLELQAYIDFMKAAAELKTAQAKNDSVKINNCISSLTDAKIRIFFFGEPEIISKLANFYRSGGIIDKAETSGLFLEFCKAVRERLSESKKIPKDTIECLILGTNTK
jgi:hypothetical protein